MTYQFKRTRYLAYLGLSLLLWGTARIVVQTDFGPGETALFLGVFGVLAFVAFRLLETLAQKHYLNKVQPIILSDDAEAALKMAERLLSVRANAPQSWQTFLIEIHSMTALLNGGRIAEADRRLAWAEGQYATLIKKDDYARFRLEGQRVLHHLALRGGEGLSSLLEAYRDAFGKVRLEIQTSFQPQRDLFELAEAAFSSADEAAWENLRMRFLAHDKASVRQACQRILKTKERIDSGAEAVDPSKAEGDLLPMRRHPKGIRRSFEVLLQVPIVLGGALLWLRACGVAYFGDVWYILPFVLAGASAVFQMVRVRFHQGVSMLLLVTLPTVFILVSMVVSIFD